MSQDSLIGQKLNNFRVDRLIGRGGMARVYYGWDMQLDRPVAIKVIDSSEQDSTQTARRLVQEARSIARWRHENIVQVYYADAQNGQNYFVMEYVEGLDLSQLLDQYRSEGALMPPDDVLRIGWAVARALDYAHTQGVIHRDLKPSNVLVANDGRIVLTDFGLALNVQQGTLGQVFGTPHYISPEQAVSSTNAVAQSDIYSLGVMLYEMLTGSVPFDDESPISLALLHVSEPPPLPTTINPDLNIATEAVLLKVLSKEPHERFETSADLMEALERALHIEQTTPHRRSGDTTAISTASIDDLVAQYMAAHSAEALPVGPPTTLSPRRTPGLPKRKRSPAYATPAALIAAGSLVGIAILVGAVLIAATRQNPPAPTPLAIGAATPGRSPPSTSARPGMRFSWAARRLCHPPSRRPRLLYLSLVRRTPVSSCLRPLRRPPVRCRRPSRRMRHWRRRCSIPMATGWC
jgi:serine/threonine protein kinase